MGEVLTAVALAIGTEKEERFLKRPELCLMIASACSHL